MKTKEQKVQELTQAARLWAGASQQAQVCHEITERAYTAPNRRTGYQIRVWAFPGRGYTYEYVPMGVRVTRRKRTRTQGHDANGCWIDYDRQPSAALPRITVDTYERQVELHRALGLPVVGRGRDWVDHGAGQLGLFDQEEGAR